MDGPQLDSAVESQLCCRLSLVVPRQMIGPEVCSPASTICPPSSFMKQRSFGFSASIYRSESLRRGHPSGSSLAQSLIATTALPTPSWCLVMSLCDEITLRGRTFLRPRSKRRLFSHLPWCFGAEPSRWGHPCRVVLRISTHSIGTKACSVHLSLITSRWGHPTGRAWSFFPLDRNEVLFG